MFALKVSVLLLVVGVVYGVPHHDGKHDHCGYKDVIIYEDRHYLPKDECLRVECHKTETLKIISCQDHFADKKCEEAVSGGVIFPDCCSCK